MKIIIEKDNGEKVVYDKVTDYSISFRHLVSAEVKDKNKNVFFAQIPEVKSDSITTGNLRDILKEIRELQRELEIYIPYEVQKQEAKV